MNMHFVDETNVLRRAIITVQDLDVVFLDQPGLVLDARRRRGDDLVEEMRPLIVGEPDIVQLLKLGAQVCDKLGFRMRGKSFIALGFEDSQQLLLQIRFALVCGLTSWAPSSSVFIRHPTQRNSDSTAHMGFLDPAAYSQCRAVLIPEAYVSFESRKRRITMA